MLHRRPRRSRSRASAQYPASASSRASSGSNGAENSGPCPNAQPMRASAASCSCVSIPWATICKPSVLPSRTSDSSTASLAASGNRCSSQPGSELHHGDGQLNQVIQRREAAAEIVDGHAHLPIRQALQNCHRCIGILVERAFGRFKHEPRWISAAGGESPSLDARSDRDDRAAGASG